MSDLPAFNQETYLGDGLYVSFDGWHVCLRAPRSEGNHWIALEPMVYQNLKRWMEAHKKLSEHMGERKP
jgi:hypothetical protein